MGQIKSDSPSLNMNFKSSVLHHNISPNCYQSITIEIASLIVEQKWKHFIIFTYDLSGNIMNGSFGSNWWDVVILLFVPLSYRIVIVCVCYFCSFVLNLFVFLYITTTLDLFICSLGIIFNKIGFANGGSINIV